MRPRYNHELRHPNTAHCCRPSTGGPSGVIAVMMVGGETLISAGAAALLLKSAQVSGLTNLPLQAFAKN